MQTTLSGSQLLNAGAAIADLSKNQFPPATNRMIGRLRASIAEVHDPLRELVNGVADQVMRGHPDLEWHVQKAKIDEACAPLLTDSIDVEFEPVPWADIEEAEAVLRRIGASPPVLSADSAALLIALGFITETPEGAVS